MNVKSHRKTTVNPQIVNQDNIPDFSKCPSPTVNLIPKEHVGKIQSNKLMPEQINNQTDQPISPQKYSETNTHHNKSLPISYDEDSSLFFFPTYLLEDSTSEENTASQPHITQKPVSESTEITNQEVQNSEESIDLNLYDNIRIIPIKEHNKQQLQKAIANHPLTPIVEEWLRQRNINKATYNAYRYKISVFITFLIDLKVQYPKRFHFLLYKYALIKSNTLKHPRAIISAARTFFKWAKDKGYYENIAKETDDRG